MQRSRLRVPLSRIRHREAGHETLLACRYGRALPPFFEQPMCAMFDLHAWLTVRTVVAPSRAQDLAITRRQCSTVLQSVWGEDNLKPCQCAQCGHTSQAAANHTISLPHVKDRPPCGNATRSQTHDRFAYQQQASFIARLLTSMGQLGRTFRAPPPTQFSNTAIDGNTLLNYFTRGSLQRDTWQTSRQASPSRTLTPRMPEWPPAPCPATRGHSSHA